MFSFERGDVNLLSLFVFFLVHILFVNASYDRLLLGKIIHKYTLFY